MLSRLKISFLLASFLIIIIPEWIIAQEIYSNEHVELNRLDERTFLLKETYSFSANCLVLAGDNGLMLIDSGFGEVGEHLVDALGALGKQVSVIVNSHAHHDHIGANHLFPKDVLVIGNGNCQDVSAQSGHQVQTVEKNPTYDFEGTLVFFISYPGGHSDCDIITYIPELNLAYLGDLYLSESFPLVLIQSGSSVETLLLHLNEIFQSLPDNTLLIPGHGKSTSMEYFGGYIALLEDSVDLVRKKMKSGWSLQRIQQADVLEKYEKFGQYFPFISKESWIEQIYLSYSE